MPALLLDTSSNKTSIKIKDNLHTEFTQIIDTTNHRLDNQDAINNTSGAGTHINGDIYHSFGKIKIASSINNFDYVFCQLFNSEKTNLAHGDGNPNIGDIPTDSSDWGIFDTWNITNDFIYPQSSNDISVKPFSISTSSITVNYAGYYKISVSILGSNDDLTNNRMGFFARFKKNTNFIGPVAGTYIRTGDNALNANDNASSRANSLYLSTIVQLSASDQVSVYTTASNNNNINIKAIAGYSQFLIERIN